MMVMRRIGGIVAALALFGARPLVAQYFGQNKVQYQSFDFHIIQNEHFEVYYYPAERAAALDGARIAERWYARLSRVLHHQFQGRKPIIFYASQSDFQQTNTTSGDVGEETGGFTEFFKHRMVLPFTGAYEELEHVVGHEMVHQFQYDVFSRGRIGAGIQTYVNINPPLWFMEGMAEYLSVGPIDNHTAMWLRDASVEGHLPTLQQLSYDEVFPYYFGHAIWAYIGEKWGDEAVGQILQASTTAGVEGAFKRIIGVTLDELISGWRDAVQTTYLPQLADHYRARRIAQPLLTRKRSEGTLHIAPALTPDGRQIAYFSEKNSFFVDLYLADAETGKVLRRLVKSTLSSNYESLRFINSAGSFSPDGHYFAIAAKRRDRDDLVILDVKKDEEVRRIPLPLNGLTTPSWSPDSKQLVFTGYDGGISDLFIVNADGSDLRRLTNDKYADLQPSWSPDGKTIAFTTDRDGETDFSLLKFGNMRIALYHLDDGRIGLLRHMDDGKNINPVWAPDGRSLAFVSDRGDGISNIFLYDFTDSNIYQLTDVYTGVTGITPLSPCLSWAHEADRLARPGQAGGQRRDAGDAGVHVRELVDVAIGEVVQKDVADPVTAVGHERQRPPVRCPHGVDVLAVVHVPEQPDASVVQVVQGDPHVAELEQAEVRLAVTVSGERDRLAVRRPRGLEVGVLVVGQPTQIRAVRVDDEQIGQPAVVAGEHELLAVGRPGGCGEPVQGDSDAPHLAVPLDVEDHEVVPVLVFRRDGEVAAVRRKGAGRVNEAQALEVAVERGFDQAPFDAPRLRVGEVQIHEERVALAEVGDVPPVRAQGRCEVPRAVRALLGEDRLRDAPGLVMLRELGQVRGLDGVPPFVHQVVDRQADRPLEGILDPARDRRLQDLADDFVAPLLADVGPDRMSEVVREHFEHAIWA